MYQPHPPRFEYVPTPKGKELKPLLREVPEKSISEILNASGYRR